jgi:hypothetical protein
MPPHRALNGWLEPPIGNPTDAPRSPQRRAPQQA